MRLILLFCILKIFGSINLNNGLQVYLPLQSDIKDYSGNNIPVSSENVINQVPLTDNIYGEHNTSYRWRNAATSNLKLGSDRCFGSYPFFSVSLWLKPLNIPNPILFNIFSKAEGCCYACEIVSNTGTVQCMIHKSGGTYESVYSSSEMVKDTWYHIVGSFDGSKLKVYLNNVKDEYSVVGTATTNCASYFRIGAETNGAASSVRWMDGSFMDMRLWNRAITAAEVEYLFWKDSPIERHLLGYYSLNEESGMDQSKHQVTGTIVSSGGSGEGHAGFESSALRFDGISTYVNLGVTQCDFSITNNTGMTLAAWVKPSDTLNERVVISRRDNASPSSKGFVLGTGRCYWANVTVEGNEIHLEDCNRVYSENWVHLAVSFDGSKVSLHRDGIEVANQSAVGFLSYANQSTVNCIIGGYNNGSPNDRFEGLIEDLFIFSRSLRTSEIQKLFDSDTLEIGLTGLYSFEGNVLDQSHQTNSSTSPAVIGSPLFVSDRHGNPNSAMFFNGLTDYVEIGNKFQLNYPFTITAWIKPDWSSGTMVFIGKSSNSGFSFYVGVDGRVQYWVNNGGVSSFNSDDVIPSTEHTFVCFLFDGNTIYGYMNSKKVTQSRLIASDILLNDLKTAIGGDAGGSQLFEGQIDEVRFYRRVLSISEIQRLSEGWSCFGVPVHNYNVSSLICSGHGKCLELDVCMCEEGYFGRNCNLTSDRITTVYATDYSSPTTCSGAELEYIRVRDTDCIKDQWDQTYQSEACEVGDSTITEFSWGANSTSFSCPRRIASSRYINIGSCFSSDLRRPNGGQMYQTKYCGDIWKESLVETTVGELALRKKGFNLDTYSSSDCSNQDYTERSWRKWDTCLPDELGGYSKYYCFQDSVTAISFNDFPTCKNATGNRTFSNLQTQSCDGNGHSIPYNFTCPFGLCQGGVGWDGHGCSGHGVCYLKHGSSSETYCDCKSGYFGLYCNLTRNTYTTVYTHLSNNSSGPSNCSSASFLEYVKVRISECQFLETKNQSYFWSQYCNPGDPRSVRFKWEEDLSCPSGNYSGDPSFVEFKNCTELSLLDPKYYESEYCGDIWQNDNFQINNDRRLRMQETGFIMEQFTEPDCSGPTFQVREWRKWGSCLPDEIGGYSKYFCFGDSITAYRYTDVACKTKDNILKNKTWGFKNGDLDQCIDDGNGILIHFNFSCPYSLVCDGKVSWDLNVCTGRGTCKTNQTCVCDSGFHSMFCELYNGTCFDTSNVGDGKSQVCSGHGTCVDNDLCVCEDTQNYGNEDCSFWECYGVGNNESLKYCSNHGDCVDYNQCQCSVNYTYDSDCSAFKCGGFLMNDSINVCSRHGICLEHDDCDCINLYGGDNCEFWTCSKISSELVNQVCSGHGSCIMNDYCSCQNGYYSSSGVVGKDCDMWKCGSEYERNHNLVCSERGNCTAAGECTCFGEFIGDECESWECFGIDQSQKEGGPGGLVVCNGEGTCRAPDQCECVGSFSGDECETNMLYFTVMTPILSVFGAGVGVIVLVIICCLMSCILMALVCLAVSFVGFLFCVCCVCYCSLCSIMGLVFFIGKQKKSLKKFGKLDDVDLLLSEQAADRDTSIAHLNINSTLFEIDFESIKVLTILGEGGSDSIVYKANWRGQIVAFKCFKTRNICSNQNKFDEFEREVEIFSSISHPNIVRFFGCTMRPPRVGIVMEFCENGELHHFLKDFLKKNSYNYPMESKMRLLTQISQGMEYLHSRKIIHRDLKCENVLLDSSETPKLMDFGLSRINARLSQAKTKRVGTSIYMAPEVCLLSVYSSKCDVFSFAIICYIVITETEDPYQGISEFGIELKVANDPDFRPDMQRVKNYLEHRECGKKYLWLTGLIKQAWTHDYKKRPSFKNLNDLVFSRKDEHVDTPIEEEDGSLHSVSELLKEEDGEDFLSKVVDGGNEKSMREEIKFWKKRFADMKQENERMKKELEYFELKQSLLEEKTGDKKVGELESSGRSNSSNSSSEDGS